MLLPARKLAFVVTLSGSFSQFSSAQVHAPPAQNNPSMAYLPSAAIGVLYGGWIIDGDSGRAGAETWALGTDGWRLVGTHQSPGPRAFHCSSAAEAGAGVLLFGGSNGDERLRDTWRFNGVAWTQVARSGPPARSSSCMAFDPVRNRVVLFGGRSNEGLLGDTWEWDGQAWHMLSTDGPSPRRHHTMAFDHQGGGVLLFGGATDDGQSGETWMWNGDEWTQVETEVAPAPRDHHAMASDPEHRRVILFGGWDGASELGDAWAWDGAAWIALEASGPRPPARGGRPAMFFEAASSALILYGGGWTDQGPRTDVWLLRGDHWEQLRNANDHGAGN